MASAPFTPEQEEIIHKNPITKTIDTHRGSLPEDLSSFEHDIDKDTKRSLKAFLYALAATIPAELIELTDSRDNLSDKLISLTKAWSGEGKFPMTLRSEFSTLLDKVASKAPDLDVWTAIAQLLTAFDLNTPSNIKKVPSHSRNLSNISSALRDLRKDWNNEYFPHSLVALQDLVQRYQQLPVNSYYARTLVFLQSSGMGKSRLVDSFGEVCPMINFILRGEGTTGFPPADPEILSFLREEPPSEMNITLATSSSKTSEISERMAAAAWNHALAAALLQASFEIFNVWVESQSYTTISLEDLARSRHTKMAPLYLGPDAHDDSSQRSNDRTEFCQDVAKRARTIANKLISKPNWATKFRSDLPSKVHRELESKDLLNPLNDLRTAVQKLINNLQQTQHRSKTDPLLVIVFDEASSLIRETAFEGLYVALNRIISCLKEYPLWSFFLSTESSIGQLVPPGNARPTGNFQVDPSARLVLDRSKPPLKRFPPFVALQLDVEDRRRMQNADKRVEELRKPLSYFANPRHMAIFGRPLWYAYEKAEDMNDVAKLKLLGGKQGSKFNPEDKDHVFAALSFRLSLDAGLQNPSNVSFIRTAVNSFMRVVISMDQEIGTMDTLTPSEPVLAKAAMEHLCYESNWTISIRTLTKELLEPALVDKGNKGELYARLVLILAHDWVRRVRYLQAETSRLFPRPAEFRSTFTVSDFLTGLYGDDHRELIPAIPERIRTAIMNFTHFVPAYKNFTFEVIPALCHDLLRRSAAIQLAFSDEAFDLLLPIYYGKEDEEFNPLECGVILVQIKNRKKATTLEDMFNENFIKVNPKGAQNPHIRDPANSIRKQSKFAFKQMAKPILLLLFDLGVDRSDEATSPLVQISKSEEILPDLWAIHSRGHDKAVFGCLQHMDKTDASLQFFSSLLEGESLADQLAGRNRTFGELQRSYRYLEFDSEADDARAQEDNVKAQKGKMKADDARAQEDNVKAQKGKMKADDVRAQEDDGKRRKGGFRDSVKNLVYRGHGRYLQWTGVFEEWEFAEEKIAGSIVKKLIRGRRGDVLDRFASKEAKRG